MALAHAVFRTLSEARFSVFLDSFALSPGIDFAERIEHELLDKAFLILIETPCALASAWVLREMAFARQHRLGIASVRADPSGPRLEGVGSARRWTLPTGALLTSGTGGPTLEASAADELRDFVSRLHTQSMLRRSQTLDAGLRAALRRAGIGGGDVTGMPLGLGIDAAGYRWAVSMRPRPANLIDMHAAARLAPPGSRRVMVSATPRGTPEQEALGWLADESDIRHWDEGRLLSLARAIAAGTA